jgi:hypothetical protein
MDDLEKRRYDETCELLGSRVMNAECNGADHVEKSIFMVKFFNLLIRIKSS